MVEDSQYPTQNRTDGEIAWTGAGQSALAVSPLHMCMAASAVANNGVMMEPWMILEALKPSGGVRASFSSRVYRQPLAPAQAAALKKLMRQAVAAGTGTAANIPGAAVCGCCGN